MDQSSKLLTALELAVRLRVSPDTVRAWARRGAIPSLRPSPKVIRFDLDAVLAALSPAPAKGVDRAK